MSLVLRLLTLPAILTSRFHNTKPQLFAAAATIGGYRKRVTLVKIRYVFCKVLYLFTNISLINVGMPIAIS
ncbi:hypothetical protein A1353_23820 [Methylomonas methanica]|uniref:Uncharacterized protein n=1 Tax=Methylomonas methanica TaxID=421 RepID=A0A177LUG0_METMH|nr:hypothetical protein A1353_23820 [Methylomonas methanica]